MISATRRWFRRNRTPLAVGVAVVGAGYLATQYVVGKINDARERMSSDRIAKENLRRRFEQNQEDCTFTVLALLPDARKNILDALQTEQITYEIQQMKGPSKAAKSGTPSIADTAMTEEDAKSSSQSDSGIHASQITVQGAAVPAPAQAATPAPSPKRKTKRQLWDDLTISSITRAFTLIYTLSLLTLLTRIQLNLLGRRSYLSSVISLASGSNHNGAICLEDHDDLNPEHAYGGDLDTNHKYLAFSWWLLNRGWSSLSSRIEDAVREVFGPLGPRESLTYEAFSQMTLQVRRKVEGETVEERRTAAWLPFLLPPRDMEDEILVESGIIDSSPPSPAAATATSSSAVRKLLDETSDLVESPVFHHVLALLLDAGFANLLDKHLGATVFELPPPEHASAEPMQSTRAVMLPRITSVLTRQAHVIGGGSMPNEYLAAMEQVPDLNAFSAVVYSANWQSEIQPQVADGKCVLDEAAARALEKEPFSTGASPRDEDGGREAAAAAGGGIVAGPGAGAVGVGASSTEASVIFVDAESEFENAWGNATAANLDANLGNEMSVTSLPLEAL